MFESRNGTACEECCKKIDVVVAATDVPGKIRNFLETSFSFIAAAHVNHGFCFAMSVDWDCIKFSSFSGIHKLLPPAFRKHAMFDNIYRLEVSTS